MLEAIHVIGSASTASPLTDGTWDRVLTAYRPRPTPTVSIDCNVSVDSSVMRVHQRAAAAARSAS